MKTPIFISGPHGSGKTTLLKRLLSKSELFIESNFEIEFASQFPSIKSLSNFERCLLLLYHRIYNLHYAGNFAGKRKGSVILATRSIYDSEAYINVYKEKQLMSDADFETLKFVLRNAVQAPFTIVLNPPVDVIMQRLEKRILSGTRGERDKAFKKQDTPAFIADLHKNFELFRNRENVLYIEDNNDDEINQILKWIPTIDAKGVEMQGVAPKITSLLG